MGDSVALFGFENEMHARARGFLSLQGEGRGPQWPTGMTGDQNENIALAGRRHCAEGQEL